MQSNTYYPKLVVGTTKYIEKLIIPTECRSKNQLSKNNTSKNGKYGINTLFTQRKESKQA